MKECSTCYGVLPLSAFNRNCRAKDGLRVNCRECQAKWQYSYDQSHKEQKKAYAQGKKGKDSRKRANRKYWVSHPERAKAHNATSNALRDGKLERPPNCEACKQAVFVEAHHPDYRRPLKVIWLCPECHRSI